MNRQDLTDKRTAYNCCCQRQDKEWDIRNLNKQEAEARKQYGHDEGGHINAVPIFLIESGQDQVHSAYLFLFGLNLYLSIQYII